MTTSNAAISIKPNIRTPNRRYLGILPSIRQKLTDTPCEKCGYSPTTLSGRSAANLERSCSICGHIEFLQPTSNGTDAFP